MNQRVLDVSTLPAVASGPRATIWWGVVGLLTIEGKLVKGVKMEDADKAVEEELEKLTVSLVSDQELQKVKNRLESLIAFEDMSLLSRCNNLAFYELLGDAEWMNGEMKKYEAVTTADIQKEARDIFQKKNSNTLYYYSAQ